MSLMICFAVVLRCCAAATSTLPNVNTFKHSFFKTLMFERGMHEIDIGVSDIQNEFVVGVGFVNQDFYTDIITLNKNLDTLSVYLYNDQQGIFTLLVKSQFTASDEKIKDAKLVSSNAKYADIVVVLQSMRYGMTQTMLRGYRITEANSLTTLELIPSYSILANDAHSAQEPLFFQFFEDNVIFDSWLLKDNGNFVLYRYDAPSESMMTRKWSTVIDMNCLVCDEVLPPSSLDLPTVFSYGIADFNGDCRADFFWEVVDASGNHFVEIYLYTDQGAFALVKRVPISASYQAGTAVDINEDGLPDLVFFDSATREMVAFFNTFVPTSGSPVEGCLATSEITFMFPGLTEAADSPNRSSWQLFESGELASNPELRVFPTLRFGDLNLDGYLDLLITVTDQDSSQILIFYSESCTAQQLQDFGRSPSFCRVFKQSPISRAFQNLLQKKSVVSSFFFDFGERGKLSVFCLEKDIGGLHLSGYLNYLESDYYFLKGIGFGNEKEFQSLSALMLMIQHTNQDGKNYFSTRLQDCNCPFGKLCLPWAHFGLGKTSSYVNGFYAGVRHIAKWNYQWTPIIPNSQLVVYSAPKSRYLWSMNMFINPSSAMSLICVCTAIILVALGIVVAYMHWKEKELDNKFRMDEINFL